MGFYERYAECCRERGIQPASQWAAEQLGCTRANISAFAKRKTTPNGETVARAAKMLDVSADYLLGIIDVPRKLDGTDSGREQEMKRLMAELNGEGKDAALAMLSGLTYKDKYSIVRGEKTKMIDDMDNKED